MGYLPVQRRLYLRFVASRTIKPKPATTMDVEREASKHSLLSWKDINRDTTTDAGSLTGWNKLKGSYLMIRECKMAHGSCHSLSQPLRLKMMNLVSLWTPAPTQFWNLINWLCCLFHFFFFEKWKVFAVYFSRNPQPTETLWSTMMPSMSSSWFSPEDKESDFLVGLQHHLACTLYSAFIQGGCMNVDPTGMTEGLSLLQYPREADSPQYVFFFSSPVYPNLHRII